MSGHHPVDILEGRKTMTRRVVKVTKKNEWLLCYDWTDEYVKDPGNFLVQQCPYGQVGGRLWVKEAFYKEADKAFYKANFNDYEAQFEKWTSSIFMPRWASRITLEITEVRVERLQEISGQDIKAEGLDVQFTIPGAFDALKRFSVLWDSLNAKRGYSWDKNHWVWVIGFKIV